MILLPSDRPAEVGELWQPKNRSAAVRPSGEPALGPTSSRQADFLSVILWDMTDHLEAMRRDWDARARQDAREHIATGLTEGALFELSGLQDAARIVEDIHPYLARDTSVLEIGCGIGRLLRYFALVFDEVHGIDVSEEMIARSKEYLAKLPNATTHRGSGADLAPFGDGSMGFVYSYVVFQHLPSVDIVDAYVRETRRVLQPGGVFKFLVKYAPWEGAGERPDTWHGVCVAPADLERWRADTGFELVNAYSVDAHVGWVILRAPC